MSDGSLEALARLDPVGVSAWVLCNGLLDWICYEHMKMVLH